MKFEYTNHAKENIEERKLDKGIIEDAVKNPERVLEGRLGRKIAEKLVGRRLLRVVYEQRTNVHIIITAYYTTPSRHM